MLANIAYAAEAGHTQVVFSLGPLEVSSEIVTMWFVMLFITVICYLGTKNLKRIPSGVQNVLEMGVEMLQNFLTELMGAKRAKQFLPLLMTFFILILCSNYSGVLPLAGNHILGYKPPTSNVSVTAGFAIVVFFTVIISGIRAKGMGYFKHFIEPVPILLPINILEQFTRPLSLSLRLYGSVYGEEMVVASLAALIPLFLPIPMQLLGLLFGAIQAFVFTLLAAMYIEEATATHH